VVAACLPFAARQVAGPRGAIIHVRWQPTLEADARQRLESGLSLANPQQLEGRTWRYELLDPSRSNIRALVTHPAAEDTHAIDRPRYAIDAGADRTDRRLRLPDTGRTVVATADRLALLLAAFAGLMAWLGHSGLARSPRAAGLLLTQKLRTALHAGRTTTLARWVSRGIPDIDAETAGAFRIVFGLAVVAFFMTHPEGASSLNATFNPIVEGAVHASVLQWLGSRPVIVDFLTPWLLTMGVAFTIGFHTRLAYALFVAGALIWAFLATVHDSTHPNSTLVLTLVALLPSRWGDALSVDRLLRRRAASDVSDTAPGKGYGFSVWVSSLVFGVAFAAAAWAKLAGAGPSWILNGSVKYHFITDSFNAPVDWGLQLAGHPLLAVTASLGAILVEALVITAAFTRNEWYRLAMGAAALSLLVGFGLFMGVFWPGWWILLLGFAPWSWLARHVRKARSRQGLTSEPRRSVRPVDATVPSVGQLAAITFVISQQVLFSSMRIERAPMFTYYPMYSSTYATPAAFDAAVAPYYRIVLSTPRGRVELACNAPDDLVADLRAALAGSSESTARVWREVRGCGSNLEDATDVTFEGDTRVFDWDRLAIRTERAAIVIGPLASAGAPPLAPARADP
jgi:hypothetical protein